MKINKKLLFILSFNLFLFFSSDNLKAKTLSPAIVRGIGQFFQTGAGTVAFLPLVKNKGDALNSVDFRVLQKNGAYEIQKQMKYWFIVNHFHKRATETTYLGVQIVPIYTQETKPKTPIYLRRNEKWTRKDDKSFDGKEEKRKAFENKTINDFIKFHGETISLEDMDAKFFKWHAIPKDSEKDSWEKRTRWKPSIPFNSKKFRNSFSNPLPQNSSMMINAILIRFSTTNKKSSKNRVVFGFDGKQPIAAYVNIFSPDALEFDNEFFLTFK